MAVNVLNEIFSWAATLPAWQADALRRLMRQGELSPGDTSDILKMIKADHGYTDASSPAPVPQPLLKSHLPALMDDRRSVVLRRMHGLSNVNALAPGQSLKFIDKGITVIYGDNAAGKSGYSRVLKRACRARDKAEAILPNVLGKTKPTGPATASFELFVQDKVRTITWTDGTPPPEELGRLIVFDSKCATFYIEKANQVIYVPSGLDVLPKMAALFGNLRAQLQAELSGIAPAPKCLGEFCPSSKTGEWVAQLSAKTSVQELERRAEFTSADLARLTQLRSKLAELKATDSKARAASLRRLKRRVEQLAGSLALLEGALSAAVISKLQNLQADAESARAAAQLASELSFANEPLPDVGGPVWREMFEAARRYSERSAYQGQVFPVVEGKARCPLCQQELGAEAKERLQRFDQFIRDDTAQQAKLKGAAFASERSRLDQLDAVTLAADVELLPEIASVAAETASRLEAYISALQLCALAVVKACADMAWSSLPTLPPSPGNELARLSEQLEAEAAELDKASQPEEQTRLERERGELEALEKLGRYKEELLTYVAGLKRQTILKTCIEATSTTNISRKASEIAKKAITGVLEKALGEEMTNLGVTHVQLQIKKAGELGNTLHQLQLANAVDAKALLSSVLSEGEQRVVAIAAFLSEIRASGAVCGMIFDDPVCSLDHNYRMKVAARLVTEGREQQVIIFTHDIIFLLALQDQAARQQIPLETQTIRRLGPDAGICEEELPWPAMDVKRRLGHLKQVGQKAAAYHAKAEQDAYEALASHGYGLLRETWERTVEERLLNDTVQRFRQGIETQRLRRVVVENGDWIRIEQSMSKCSEWMTGHDKAAGKGTPFPDPSEFKADIVTLEAFLQELQARQDKAEKGRRVLEKPPALSISA